MLGSFLDDIGTSWIVKDIATLEHKKPEEVKLDSKPEHKVFADAYLLAEETFAATPEKVFKMLNSPEGLQAILPVDSVKPAAGAPEKFKGLGDHYLVSASSGLSAPIAYDMFIISYDPPYEARYYLYAYGAAMEIDVLMVPTLKGTKALILFILDMPDSVQGQALDVMIHASDIDKKCQQKLDKLKNG